MRASSKIASGSSGMTSVVIGWPASAFRLGVRDAWLRVSGLMIDSANTKLMIKARQRRDFLFIDSPWLLVLFSDKRTTGCVSSFYRDYRLRPSKVFR